MEHLSAPSYSLAERDRRWNLAREVMKQEGVDAMIIYGEHEDSGPAAFAWDTWFTNGRPGSTVIFPQSGTPIELIPFHLFILDHSMAKAQNNPFWIPTEHIRLGRHSGAITQVLSELKLEQGKIGVVGLDAAPPWHMEGLVPYQLWKRVLDAFPDAKFTSVSDALVRKAIVLSEEELKMVRHAARIGEDMAQAMVDATKIGREETDIYHAASTVAHANGIAAPGMHLFVADENAECGPPQWTYRPHPPRTLQNGDTLHSEVFSTYGQRHTQHQLTIAIGEVHPNIERAASVVREYYDAGLRTLRAGVRFGDVCKAMLEPTEHAGGWVRGPQIHSLNPLVYLCGLSEPLAERFNSIYTAEGYPAWPPMGNFMDDLVLEAGMTFALEPSCGFGKHLVTIGGTIIVGEDGPEELNPFTAQPQRVSGE